MGGGTSKQKATKQIDQQIVINTDKNEKNLLKSSYIPNIPQGMPKPDNDKRKKEKLQVLNIQGELNPSDNYQLKDSQQNTRTKKSEVKNQSQKPINDITLNLSEEFLHESIEMEQDLSPINAQKTDKENQLKLFKKVEQFGKISELLSNQFQWPLEGKCQIVTSSYKFEYNPLSLKILLLNNYDTYTTSQLSWKFDKNHQAFEFHLQDEEIYDLNTDKLSKLPPNQIKFIVNSQGQFVGLKGQKEYLRQIQNISNEKNEQQILKQTEEALKKMWSESMESWSANKQQQQQLQNQHQNIRNNMSVVNAMVVKDKKELQQHLEKQLENDKFFQACFNSKKTIKDRLRLWGLDEESQNEDQTQSQQEWLHQRATQTKFKVLEKYDCVQALVGQQNNYPQSVIANHSKKIVLDHKRDLFVDFQQELRMYAFLWPENSERENEQFYLTELSRFKDVCDTQLKQSIIQLSTVNNLPLPHRTKVKGQYFHFSN